MKISGIDVDANWRKKVVDDTLKIVNMYSYEDNAIWYDHNERDEFGGVKKKYLRQPIEFQYLEDAYRKQRQVILNAHKAQYAKDIELKKLEFDHKNKQKEIANTTSEFRNYYLGIKTRDQENKSNEAHLKDCIEICNQLGNGYEEHIKASAKVLTTYNREVRNERPY